MIRCPKWGKRHKLVKFEAKFSDMKNQLDSLDYKKILISLKYLRQKGGLFPGD